MLNRPPAWTNPTLRVYHGTTEASADAIQRDGIQVARGIAKTDFGPGFYTTTREQQARDYAWAQSEHASGSRPAVLRIDLDRDQLAKLETISFVRGDADADDFWSFVVHCRTGGAHHGRPGGAFYDVAFGPVAAFWKQRVVMYGADQISFHTATAERLLNASRVTRIW